LPQLERSSGVRRSVAEHFRTALGAFPLAIYTGTIGLLTAYVSGSLFRIANDGTIHWGIVALFRIVMVLSSSHFATAIVNWIATLWVAADSLPKMDFSEGVPPESRTLTVVPTMLTNLEEIEGLVEALEVRFLANRDDNLHFALLTDFQDAPEQTIPERCVIVAAGKNKNRRAERK
jgi:membrane glycosyltransferase